MHGRENKRFGLLALVSGDRYLFQWTRLTTLIKLELQFLDRSMESGGGGVGGAGGGAGGALEVGIMCMKRTCIRGKR